MGTELYKVYEDFGDRLKKKRKERYKTQELFADDMDVSVETVRNWEQGRVLPNQGNLFRIAKLLDCDIDFLTGRLETRTHDVKFISDMTGLSPNAVEKLIEWKDASDRRKKWGSYISHIITSKKSDAFFGEMSDMSGLVKVLPEYSKDGMESAINEQLTARLWHISKIFSDIVESFIIGKLSELL